MSPRDFLPYYFEVPEMPLIPFDVTKYFTTELQREIAMQDNKNPEDLMDGESRSQSANWYQS